MINSLKKSGHSLYLTSVTIHTQMASKYLEEQRVHYNKSQTRLATFGNSKKDAL